MKKVVFNPNGGPLFAKAVFLPSHVMAAAYDLLLRAKDSHSQVTLLEGDNLNPEDDISALANPPILNEGRRVILKAFFAGVNIVDHPQYLVRLEIWQDDELIGFDADSGDLTGKGQSSVIFIHLVTTE